MKTFTVLALFAAVAVMSGTSCGGQRREERAGEAQQPEGRAEQTERSAEAGAAERKEGEPKETGEAEEKQDEIELPPDVQRRLGIVVKTVGTAQLTVPLQVVGSVQPIPSRVTHIRPFARGRVQDVRVRIGDRVSRGQELARFDNIEAGELAAEYDAAQADLARLRVQLATATRQAERAKRLAEIGAAPQREYEASLGEQQQIEAAIKAQESRVAGLNARRRRFGVGSSSTDSSITTIAAPFAGVVIETNAAPGDVVEASSELFEIADISRVYVHAQVFEKDLGRLQRNQPASISVDAYPDERFTGRVVAIGDTVDPKTRTVAVFCEVANPDGLLKLDMFARIDLPTPAMKPGLAVPSEAVQTFEGRRVVFVRTGDAAFTVKPVEIGRVAGGLTEITRGLEEGEAVVAEGAFKVKSALMAGELGEEEEEKKE